jgi:hypothetical protein
MSQLKTQETCVKRLLHEWPLVFVFGCIVFMLHPMLHADFGMIDDHEIVSILGRDNRVKISELSPLIQQWAGEEDTGRGRFRPAYYVLRVLEAFVVGGHASLWYTNRLLLALVSALALYWGLRVILFPFPAGVVTLLFFSGPQNEIWTRLGPQEAYGVPLVLAGLAWIAVQLGRHKWQPTRLFPGFVVLLLAGLVKESFVPVLPGVLVFIYIVMPSILPSIVPGRSQLRLLDVLILLLLVTGIGMQGWLTVRTLNYNNDRQLYQRLAEISLGSFLLYVIERYSKDTLWFVQVVVGLAGLLPRNSQEWKERSWRGDLMKATVLLAAGGFLILVPQCVVHNGTPHAGRYLTPGNLFIVFAAALGLYLCSNNFVERGRAKLRSVVAAMLIAVTLFRVFGTYRAANAAALSSHKFQTTLAEIVELKTQHPELPLLFYSTNVSSREPLISVARFLAVRLPNLEQPFLNTYNWETGADSLEKIATAKSLRKESLEGDKFFAKISDFRGSNGRCIAVIFSGFTENFRCVYSVRVSEL